MKKSYIILAIIIVVIVVVFWISYSGQYKQLKELENLGADSVATSSASVAGNQKPTNPKVEAASKLLIGVWESEDDPQYHQEFRADGTVIESYVDADSTSGTYRVFNAEMDLPVGVEFQLNNYDEYIQTIINGEKYNYRIVNINSNELQLMYMDRGSELRFSKVK